MASTEIKFSKFTKNGINSVNMLQNGVNTTLTFVKADLTTFQTTFPTPTGPQGAAGANGSTGLAGPTGSAGSNGPNGAAGPTGPTGARGATGPPGANRGIGYAEGVGVSCCDFRCDFF